MENIITETTITSYSTGRAKEEIIRYLHYNYHKNSDGLKRNDDQILSLKVRFQYNYHIPSYYLELTSF